MKYRQQCIRRSKVKNGVARENLETMRPTYLCMCIQCIGTTALRQMHRTLVRNNDTSLRRLARRCDLPRNNNITRPLVYFLADTKLLPLAAWNYSKYSFLLSKFRDRWENWILHVPDELSTFLQCDPCYFYLFDELTEHQLFWSLIPPYSYSPTAILLDTI